MGNNSNINNSIADENNVVNTDEKLASRLHKIASDHNTSLIEAATTQLYNKIVKDAELIAQEGSYSMKINSDNYPELFKYKTTNPNYSMSLARALKNMLEADGFRFKYMEIGETFISKYYELSW